MDAGIQHRTERFDHHRTHSTVALRQRVGAEQHHGAHFSLAERRADTAGMAANQIQLQLPDLIGRDPYCGEFAEAGIDAVDRCVARRQHVLDDRARSLHALAGFWS
jgi:hypothetical protein